MKSMNKATSWLVIAGLAGLLLSGCAHQSNPAVPLEATANTTPLQVNSESSTESDDQTPDYTVPMDIELSNATESEETATPSVTPTPEPTVAPTLQAVWLSASISDQKTTGFLNWKKLEITIQVKNSVFYRRSGRLLVTFTHEGQEAEKLEAFRVDLGAGEIRNYTFRSTVHADAASVALEAS
ncbi:MAG TPA: hypothetical protein DD435_11975 [Cyanobacteria bacterium UBA8530]|nr:hypothetical protein [Cyanobacteria bacterium UBA8530]